MNNYTCTCARIKPQCKNSSSNLLFIELRGQSAAATAEAAADANWIPELKVEIQPGS